MVRLRVRVRVGPMKPKRRNDLRTSVSEQRYGTSGLRLRLGLGLGLGVGLGLGLGLALTFRLAETRHLIDQDDATRWRPHGTQSRGKLTLFRGLVGSVALG